MPSLTIVLTMVCLSNDMLAKQQASSLMSLAQCIKAMQHETLTGGGKVSMWNACGGQKQALCVERLSALDPPTESDTVTNTKLLSLLLVSFWVTMGLMKMFGCSVVVTTIMV